MLKIKKNDEVIVLTGRDKGKRGKVLKVLLKQKRALVEGINLIKKHQKPNPSTGAGGGVITREASIHISNIALYNPTTKSSDRVGIKVLQDGRKVRYFKSNNELVDI